MDTLRNVALSVVAATAVTATAAQADGFYGGVGLGYAMADSEVQYGGLTSKLDTAVVGLTGGYRWDVASGFAAAEVDGDFSFGQDFKYNGGSCSDGASGPYYCTQNATIRLRGIYGAPVAPGWEIYGALGVGMVFGDAAVDTFETDSAMNYGVTAGLGAQYDMSQGKLRMEVVYDGLTSNGTKPSSSVGNEYEPDYEATTIKVSYLFSF